MNVIGRWKQLNSGAASKHCCSSAFGFTTDLHNSVGKYQMSKTGVRDKRHFCIRDMKAFSVLIDFKSL